ncbi:MAG: DUF1127 domain-containing protein [Pseudomonadota bacterium]
MATMIKAAEPTLDRVDGNCEQAPERPVGLPGTTVPLAQRFSRMLRLHRERQRVALELKSLSDAQLKDLGFHRSEISSVLHGAGHDTSRRLYGADAAGWPTGSKAR